MTDDDEVVVLDTDVLSQLARAHPTVVRRARSYLSRHGRFTLSAVSVFERLRGYRAALGEGKPYEPHLRQFEALVAASVILPLDVAAADHAAHLWAALSPKRRRGEGDILIAAIAASRALPLATRNRRDFDAIAAIPSSGLRLVDWTR